MPELLFPPGGLDYLFLKHLQELWRLAKSSSRSGRGPITRVVNGEMPGSRATHAEAANHDAIFIDGILLFHCVQRFEQVHFAGQLIGIAVSPVEMQHDGVARRELTAVSLALI